MAYLLCMIGSHKLQFFKNGKQVSWVSIGEQYVMKCAECGKETEPFELNRKQLP